MSKNLEELKELVENEKDFNSLRLQDFIIYYLIPVLEDLEDFDKQLENGNNSGSGLEKLNRLINFIKEKR